MNSNEQNVWLRVQSLRLFNWLESGLLQLR